MLKNYLIVALRNLLRNKFYSAIAVLGLATGIAGFVLIILFVQDEIAYDRFHSKADRIYRLAETIDNTEGQGENSSSNPFPVARALKNDYPKLIEEYVRLFNFQVPTFTVQYGDQKFNEKKIFFTDSSFFRVFDFPLAAGNAATALSQPNSIVLTRELARKYFGSADPVGKTLRFEGVIDLQVSGVTGDIPEQSHIKFTALISFATLKNMMGPNFENQWIWNPCWTYILLRPGVSPGELERQFPSFIKKYYPGFMKPQVGHYLQKLGDIHLYSKLDYEMAPNSDARDVYIFSLIGLFILGVACINFTNLTTARSASRAREVGMRKVLGAHRSQLIIQFLSESLLLSMISVLIAIALIEICLPVFNSLSGKNLSLALISEPWLIAELFLIGIVTGLAAGLYPAFFLASFHPARVLKGNAGPGSGSLLLRRGLVVLQFVISLSLIMGTAVIYRQLDYLHSADLGFRKDHVMVIPVRPPLLPKLPALKNELLRNKDVLSMTTMNDIMGKAHNTHEFNYEGMQPGKWIYFPALIVGEDFSETFKLRMLAGRSFSKEFRNDDSLGVIINEAMVRHLNWGTPENAVGKQFFTPNGRERVIGVVQNFNFVSLEQPIGPFVLDMPRKQEQTFWTKYVALRIAPANISTTIRSIERQWTAFAPAYPFEYSFLDDDIRTMYASQDNLGKLVGYFSAFAIFIAALGLFTLASFAVQQRTKEIGIRKVLGASVSSILLLIARDFLGLVVIALALAIPIAWFGMNTWLESFAYRVEISAWIFVAAGCIGIIIAVATVSFHSIRASLSDPIQSLRYE